MAQTTDNDVEMTPHQRLTAVAEVLAAAIVRLHARAALKSDSSGDVEREELSEFSLNRLEVSGGSRLSVCPDRPVSRTPREGLQ